MIRQNPDGTFTVYSESGKRLSKPYKTKDEATKRLREIEYFKATKGKRK